MPKSSTANNTNQPQTVLGTDGRAPMHRPVTRTRVPTTIATAYSKETTPADSMLHTNRNSNMSTVIFSDSRGQFLEYKLRNTYNLDINVRHYPGANVARLYGKIWRYKQSDHVSRAYIMVGVNDIACRNRYILEFVS